MAFVKKSLEEMMQEIAFRELAFFDYLIPDEYLGLFIIDQDYLALGRKYLGAIVKLLGDNYSSFSFNQRLQLIGLALENSFRRGNNVQTYLPVSIKIFEGENGRILRIRDSGNGFDFENKITEMRAIGSDYIPGAGCGLRELDKFGFEASYEGNGSILNIMFKTA